jgi:hypothetical protein
MKLFLLLLFGWILAPSAQAQPSWTVHHNTKLRIKTSEESEEKNVLTLKTADLKKKGQLQVSYSDAEKQKGWVRTILYIDSTGEELLKTRGALSQVANATLLSLASKAKTIHVYTIYLPSDPAEAATVRVRRVHLCTLTVR